MIRLSFPLTCLFLFGSLQTPSETDWRGLSPIKSSRMDVERTLGPPDYNRDNKMLSYRLRDMVVSFSFNGNPNCQQKVPHSTWNVTADTLTEIDVDLSPAPLVENTGIDLSKYTKLNAGGDLLYRYFYFNDDKSFTIEVGNNYLGHYYYRPGGKHKHLQCERSKQ